MPAPYASAETINRELPDTQPPNIHDAIALPLHGRVVEAGLRLILTFVIGLVVGPVGVSVWAGNPGPDTKLDAKLAAAYAGSYALAKDQVIDIGPMGEMGGDLVFLNSKTLREGRLHQISDREFVGL